ALPRRVGAAAEAERAPESDRTRPRGERFAVDQRSAHERQLAFVSARKAAHQKLADEKAEHGVSEEFQALVIDTRSSLLVREARMSERLVDVREIAREAQTLSDVLGEHAPSPRVDAIGELGHLYVERGDPTSVVRRPGNAHLAPTDEDVRMVVLLLRGKANVH